MDRTADDHLALKLAGREAASDESDGRWRRLGWRLMRWPLRNDAATSAQIALAGCFSELWIVPIPGSCKLHRL